MIGKVLRGSDVGGLLRYLFGPGRANEHTDPRVVASWDGQPSALAPPLTGGRYDVRDLAGLLTQPLAAAARVPDRPVWHCSVRVAPGDRRLTDAEWRDVARDVVHATGLAPRDDDGACRWVAVRHADDHVHVVVTLARQDGRAARPSNDFYRVGQACRAAEKRLRLTPTAPRDRTAARRPTRGEQEKAVRVGRREPPRVTLQREARVAAAGSVTGQEFLDRLAQAGLLVRTRTSDPDPQRVTGYAVALPGDRTRDGRPVWFAGGRLASDLSWPRLLARWPATAAGAGTRRLSAAERARSWRDAARVAAAATEQVTRYAVTDPGAASDLAHATADLLAATARTVEGRRPGPLTAAADAFARAGREVHGRTPPPTPTGHGLRSVARLLAAAGRAGRDEATQVLALVTNLAALADAVADLRLAQHRAAQAAAAGRAAAHLNAASATPPRPGPVVHSRAQGSAIHSPVPGRPAAPPSRRRVLS